MQVFLYAIFSDMRKTTVFMKKWTSANQNLLLIRPLDFAKICLKVVDMA